MKHWNNIETDSRRPRSMGNTVAVSTVEEGVMERSVFAQVYRRAEPMHGFLTPLQMIEKMVEAAGSWDMSDKEPYMRFLIRVHGAGVVSETMALHSIQREDHSWSLKGYVRDRPDSRPYPFNNYYLNDGYDGIEIVGRVSHEDESWQDWIS
jgi:hypothetical protein